MNLALKGVPHYTIEMICGWKRIPRTYLRAIARAAVINGIKQVLPADRLAWGELEEKPAEPHAAALRGAGRRANPPVSAIHLGIEPAPRSLLYCSSIRRLSRMEGSC